MNKSERRTKEKKILHIIGEVKGMVKKYGIENVRSAFNRYFIAVRTVARLKKDVDLAEAELKKALGKIKI
jgi:hypothetical protein